MTELLEVYKCEKCGNIVKVIHAGGGQLVCCGVPMIKMEEKTADTGKEKHVPVLEKVEGGVKVKVGSVPHPMEENHHIEWIEVRSGSKICVHKLNPGDVPEAIFPIDDVDARVRIYCNIHGLWTNRK